MSNQGEKTQPALPAPSGVLPWTTLIVALVTLGGSLGLSVGLGLKACPLCFYQRTFAMSLVGVLAMGLLTRTGSTATLSVLALPLATAGAGVALFHVSLEMSGKLECPPGLAGLGSAPQQSLAMFALLLVVLLTDAITRKTCVVELTGGLILGTVLAYASTIANPPPPPAPTQPYEKAPDICRPPFRSF